MKIMKKTTTKRRNRGRSCLYLHSINTRDEADLSFIIDSSSLTRFEGASRCGGLRDLNRRGEESRLRDFLMSKSERRGELTRESVVAKLFEFPIQPSRTG